MIDIKPISEIMNESKIKVDELGREYDYSMKNYKVLCRNGWSDVKYVYRHKTNKPIYNISDNNNNLSVDVTEDHSLFDENKNEIKPSEIRKNTKLEYYSNDLNFNNINISDKIIEVSAKLLANGSLDRVPCNILNSTKENANLFLKIFNKINKNTNLSKTCQAGLLFLSNKK